MLRLSAKENIARGRVLTIFRQVVHSSFIKKIKNCQSAYVAASRVLFLYTTSKIFLAIKERTMHEPAQSGFAKSRPAA